MIAEEAKIREAAQLLRSMGAREVFVFGSAARGELREESDVDLAVTGLPPRLYFSAVSKAWDVIGRPVDLVDLDEDRPIIRHLRASGDLIRVD